MNIAEFEKTLVQPKPGRTLIVGSKVYENSRRDRGVERFPGAIGLDMLPGDGVDLVHDLEAPLEGHGLFDHIECLSVMEHSRRPWLLAANIESLLAPGGTLYIRAPFVWRVHAYPSDYFRYTVEGVKALFTEMMRWQYTMFFSGDRSVRKAPVLDIHGMPYFARTECALFGRCMRGVDLNAE